MSNDDKTVKIKFEGVDNVSSVFNRIKQTVGGSAASLSNRFGFGGSNMGVPTGPAAAKEKIHDRKIRAKQKEATKQRREQEKADRDHTRFLNKELQAEKQITREKEKQQRLEAKAKSAVIRGGGGGPKGRGGSLGALGAAAAGPAGIALTLATSLASKVVGFMKSQITSGYSAYVNYGRARAGLAGMGNPSSKLLHSGQSSGFSMLETIQQMQGMGRATGVLTPITKAQQMARSYGGNVSDVTSFFGTLTRAGQGFGGKAGVGGKSQIRHILSDAFKSGLDKSRAGEVLQSVAQGVRTAQGATAGAVDASRISGMLSFFSRSGMSGLQGARGAQVMGALDSTIKGAGRLSADSNVTKTLLLQSQGFGVPGGSTDYLSAMGNLEQGVFGQGGASNLVKMVSRIKKLGGNRQMQAAQLSAMTGGKLNQSVSGSVLDVMAKGGSKHDVLKSIEAITKEQRPINEKLLDNSSENLHVARRAARLENRLVEIGKKSAKDIESMQDSMLMVADDLMPAAIAALHVISSTVSTVAAGIHALLRNVPGGQDDMDRAAAVTASRSGNAFLTKYGHGTGKLRNSSRGSFTAEAHTAVQNQLQVLRANDRGLLHLSPEQIEATRLNLRLFMQEEAAARAGRPMANVGSHATSRVLGRRLRRQHGQVDLTNPLVAQYGRATMQDQYYQQHNKVMPSELLDQAMLDLFLRIGETAQRGESTRNELLDMSTYRSIIAASVETVSSQGRVE